ncbi:hypothetical protein AXY43_26240 [Clostridium sp. MF28]|uniref:hypothetical protein n=1 Tax=Clostridium TaxID=1485 RepID=UPI000CF94973|nr:MULTISPECIES: hypothetical protein [Clostridium]AVK51232.1 hypothetical protein AXY43_26240 [Clostridium sp. MF28]PSM55121.1 hypothetical protein C4L39_24535 [Clostridium diolis]
MINPIGSARLLWTINRLNAINNNECYNFKAMCERIGMDYNKVNAFLEISNGIMNKNIDFGPLLKQYDLQEKELDELANNIPPVLA